MRGVFSLRICLYFFLKNFSVFRDAFLKDLEERGFFYLKKWMWAVTQFSFDSVKTQETERKR